MSFAIQSLSFLREEDFPDFDLFDRTSKVIARATKFGPMEFNGEIFRGSIENTLRRSRRSTFEKLANEIYAISREIEQRRGGYQEF